jgi:molybdopterin synthase catalytic subunit
MRITVRLFAVLRERAGCSELDLDLPAGATAGDAMLALSRETGIGDLGDELPIGVAVNREYSGRDALLSDGDEVALIPPVSGGEAAVRVLEEPLDPARLTTAVGRPGAGAVVTFCGTTRDVPELHYEAYREMAEERINTIVQEVAASHGLEAAAAEHRVGVVPLGEPSVVVAVSAAHRQEAFSGAREIIDRIKAEAPIWKREVDGDRAEWVSGSPPPGS